MKQPEELVVEDPAVREQATAIRLGRFRGTMCDADFARLVKDVLRLRDKSDGRFAVSPFAALAGTLFAV